MSRQQLGLIRLAYVMPGDRAAAEDVVQEAFYNLYRRWDLLANQDSALQYAHRSVMNGCRSVLRGRAVRRRHVLHELSQGPKDLRPGVSPAQNGGQGRGRTAAFQNKDRSPELAVYVYACSAAAGNCR